MNTAYRVWDGEQMHYWDDKGVNLVFQDNGRWSLWQGYGDRCVASSNDGKSVLMWGIGLKDKYDKDIYDKDIDMTADEPMIVIYKDGHYGLKFPSEIGYMDTCVYWGECDIAGNVYENPELLEGAE
ncbi:YopX family protein [Bacillus atrophaeus]|uniref:YopX family protein n=1 Tax=Bacillus atrophaeus TaxID=1452 RepID=UPI00227F7236|nr:YopX family protein [Bacillus atrophaeus]MCY8517919.1 YopX family protein [Bacillus atrophaeus]